MWAGLGWIDVLEGKRILSQVRRVGITPDAEIIVLPQAAKLVGDVTAFRVDRLRVRVDWSQKRERVKVRPAFTHALCLEQENPHATADQPIAEPVSVFVEDHRAVQVAVAIGSGID